MTQPTPAATTPAAGTDPTGGQTPAAAAPAEPVKNEGKKSLEDSLGSLDDATRQFVLGEVSKARSEAQGLRARLKEAEPKLSEYDALIEASKTDAQRKDEELARWQSEAEKWRSSAVSSTITALATDFADPSDAATALDPAKYLDSGGQINEAAIKADLAAVLERKPHWRRQEGTPTPRVPAPNRAQGSSGTPPAADPAAEFAAILQGRLHGSQ